MTDPNAPVPPYSDQPDPTRPYSGQPNPGQSYSNQQYSNEPYSNQQYSNQPAPPQPQYGSPASYQNVYSEGPIGPRGLSITSMVLGLASLFFWFTFLIPLVGFILGVMGRKREPDGRGFAVAGLWLNGVMLAITVLSIVGFIVLFAVFGIATIPGIFGGFDSGYSTGIES